jgi:hypothetical protein
MKIKNKSLLITILSFIFITQSYAQTGWVNVEGKTNEKIKAEIIRAVTKAKTVDTRAIRETEELLEKDNLSAKEKFNKLEAQYTQTAMDAQSTLNRAKMNRLNAVSELNAIKTSVETQYQMLADADSAIAAEKAEIRKKKDETFEALKEIEFVTVALSVFENAPNSGFQPYDDAMRYQIARQSSEAELGLDVINASIVENSILAKNRIEIKLQGKAKLELETQKIRHQSKGDMQTDRVRYGLITVSKYIPETSQDLLKPPKKQYTGKITTFIGEKDIDNYLEKEFSKKMYYDDGVTEWRAAASKIKKLKSSFKDYYSKVNLEHSKAKNKIESLGLDAKQYLDDRERSIQKSLGAKEISQNRLAGLIPQLNEAIADSVSKLNAEYAGIKEAKLWNDANRLHKQSERRTKTLKAIIFEGAFDNESKERATRIRIEYDDFLTNTNQAIINEKTTVIDDEFTEELATKKTSAKITAYKIIGKFYDYDELTDKDQIGTAFALQYGFEYDKKSDLTVLPPPPESTIQDRLSDTISNIKEGDVIALSPTPTPTPTPTPITKATKKTNNINITSNPNADVFVAGQKIGKTPLQYYLDPSSPHGIVLKKKGYRDKTDVVSVSAGRMVTKNYKLDKAEKVAKKSGGSKWLLYAIVGGGVAYAAMGQKKEGPKTGSLSITISIPN